MNKILVGLFLFVACAALPCQGQFTKTIELKPIQNQGWKYFYDFKRVKSPYALQIPLQALNDEEIEKRYRRFSNYQDLRGIAYLVPVILLFTAPTQDNSETFLALLAGSIVADLTFTILSHHELKKAIGRYDEKILTKNSVGLQWQHLPNQQLFGLSFRHRLVRF